MPATSMTQTQKLGNFIARERHYQGITQEQLAKDAGVSWPSVQRLEAGKGVQTATLDAVLRALSLVLSVKRG